LSADRSAKKTVSGHSKPILDPEPSAALRDQLAVELREINSAEEAASWAHRVLGAKNSLTAADAAYVEEAFRAKLAILASNPADGPETPQETERCPQILHRSDRGKKGRQSPVIDKSVQKLRSELNDRLFRKFVSSDPQTFARSAQPLFGASEPQL
jgi:hypothetical protein